MKRSRLPKLPEEAIDLAWKSFGDEEPVTRTEVEVALDEAAPAIEAAAEKHAVEAERERLARKKQPGLPPILQSLHDAAPELATIVMAALTVAEEGAMNELARLTLIPFTEAKPMPGRGDDIYRIEVPGEALCRAKAALAALDSDREGDPDA